MKRLTNKQQKQLDVAEVLNWHLIEHIFWWMTGDPEENKPLRDAHRALVKKGSLIAVPYGKKLLYSTPERVKIFVPPKHNGWMPEPIVDIKDPHHGLGVTECMVRLMLSTAGTAISEKTLRTMAFGPVPDGGIISDFLYLIEFQTEHSAYRTDNLVKKLESYNEALPAMKEAFGLKVTVLFVYDVPHYFVRNLAKKALGYEPFYFTDYETFCRQKHQEQLDAPIYIWGGNGQTYNLRKDR